ncbi:MAG: hypothetical protein IKZ82_02390 [Clostridia bacterium]|nr:hypothetical protein [Clostridia bacterium]
MRKTIAILCSALMALLMLPVFADIQRNDSSSVPDDVLEYARGTGVKLSLELLKDPAAGYLGKDGWFASEAEIDALKLGDAVYRLSQCSELQPDGVLRYAKPIDAWLFSLDNADGPVVLFDISKENGELCYAGVSNAFGFVNAMNTINRLAKANNIADYPVIISSGLNGLLFFLSFNGDERVMTIPLDKNSYLHKAYSEVKSYDQLPTDKEFAEKVLEVKRLNDSGEILYGSGFIELAPQLDAKAEPTGSLRALLPVGLAVIAAAAAVFVIVFVKKNRERCAE